MKIAILTFHNVPNYGAFLQMYALSTIVKSLGHEVHIINLPLKPKHRLTTKILNSLNNISFNKYRAKFLNITKELSEMTIEEKNQFDLYIVGSDQVWNKKITEETYLQYFFDFVRLERKKISYAASFGQDRWIYNDEQTESIRKCLLEFQGVSVREDIGVEFCQTHLGIDAELVVDPTLLLKAESYDDLIATTKSQIYNNVTCYKFKKDNEFFSFCERFTSKYMLQIDDLKGVKPFKKVNNIMFPSIATWLKAIKEAKYVITDSFHGVCFSIIFKKNFVVIPADISKFNRISSLLASLNLEDRIFYSYNEILDDDRWKKEIDYVSVDEKLDDTRMKSLRFLKRFL